MALTCPRCRIPLPEEGRYCSRCSFDVGGDAPTRRVTAERLGLPGRFEVVRPLGEGGWGQVYLCSDRNLGVEVAIKVLPPGLFENAEASRQLEQAARLAARLRRHPGILPVYDFASSGSTQYITMEHAPGGSLHDRLKRDGPLPETECCRVGVEAASALHYAHRKRILHRDIKPANLLLDEDGAIQIADFGIARIRDEAQKSQLTLAGTAAFMAPEVLLRLDYDGAVDLYSLGVSLYMLSTGSVPFDGSFFEVAFEKTRKDAEACDPRLRNPALSEEFAAVVRTLTSPRPTDRFTDALACAEALNGILQDHSLPLAPVVVTADIDAEAPSAAIAARPAPEPIPGDADPLLGSPVSDFRIVRRLGQSTLGPVYLARDMESRRTVALKILSPAFQDNPEYLQVFLREGISLARIQSSHVVTVHKLGRDPVSGHHFVAMELLPGPTVGDILEAKGPLSHRRAAEIALEACEGLDAVHAQDVTHRNITPWNLMLDGENRVKLIGFSLARPLVTNFKSTMLKGDPHYMAPELFEGAVPDGRADLFSLGATLHHLLTGKPPFPGESVFQVTLSVMTREPPPLEESVPDVPPGLADLVRTLLRKDPNLRCPSARAAAGILTEILLTPEEAATCPACGGPGRPGWRFCPGCGERIPGQEERPTA